VIEALSVIIKNVINPGIRVNRSHTGGENSRQNQELQTINLNLLYTMHKDRPLQKIQNDAISE